MDECYDGRHYHPATIHASPTTGSPDPQRGPNDRVMNLGFGRGEPTAISLSLILRFFAALARQSSGSQQEGSYKDQGLTSPPATICARPRRPIQRSCEAGSLSRINDGIFVNVTKAGSRSRRNGRKPAADVPPVIRQEQFRRRYRNNAAVEPRLKASNASR